MPDALTEEANTWYAGRAEDSYPRAVKIFGVEPRHDAGFVYEANENGVGEANFSWTSPTPTYRYTYVRDHGDNGWDGYENAYSAAGINEYGVSCSATLSIYANTDTKRVDPAVDDGIGEYSYVSIALGQSKTAREAVELLGSLVSEYGACSQDQIIISDNTQSWMLAVVSGHQWVAFQLPEDQASANPNMGSLWYKINLDDTKTCIHSEELVSLPEENGFLKTFEDGTPDIARTYSRDNEGNGQFSRYVIGRAYFDALQGLEYTVSDAGAITGVTDGPLFFTPGRGDWTTFEMIRSLGATARNVTGLKDNVSATVTGVGRQDSLESHVFEIKRNTDPQIATVEWLALNRDEFSVAIPNYGALMTKVNWRYGTQDLSLEHQGARYSRDDVTVAMTAGDHDQYLPYVLMDINSLANSDRENLASGVREYLDALQKALIEDNDKVEAALYAAAKGDREALATKAADVAAELTWEKCFALLTEARNYLNGDKAELFVASDYDAANGTLKEDLGYAEAVVPSQPDSSKPETPVAPAEKTMVWKQNSKGWWLEDENGNFPTNQWAKQNGKWYYFDGNGYMKSGWQKISGKWYHLGAASDGAMKSGWQKIGGFWYYFGTDGDGAMKSGWQKINGKWYHLGAASDGAMKSGWQKIGGSWYLLGGKNDGAMKTGWQKVGAYWYLLGGQDDGAMKTGWQKVDGKWYYLDKVGAMASSTWVGPYWVNASGAWTRTR